MSKFFIYFTIFVLFSTNMLTQYLPMHFYKESLVFYIRDQGSPPYPPALFLSDTTIGSMSGAVIMQEWFSFYDYVHISGHEKQELIDSLSTLGGTKYSLDKYSLRKNIFSVALLRGDYLELFSSVSFEKNSNRIFEILRNVLNEERSSKAISVINKLCKINKGELDRYQDD